jgi:hypothetical protein
MTVPPRRKVDVNRLPLWARYLLGAAVAAIVAALVWRGADARTPPHWYATGVRVAAVGLLVVLAVRLVRAVLRRR